MSNSSITKFFNKKKLIKGAKIAAGVAAVAATGYIIYKGIEYKKIITKRKDISNLFSTQQEVISYIYDPTIKTEWQGDVGLINLFLKEYLIKNYKNKVCAIPKPYVALKFIGNTISVYSYDDKNGLYDKDLWLWDAADIDFFKTKILDVCENNLTVIPITIEINNSLHANMLIYNKSKNTIEHYEPYGNYLLPENKYDNIKDFFKKMEITYCSPHITCPRFGPQSHELKCLNSILNVKSPGFCVLWSLWMADLRISNPNAKSSELIASNIKKITENNIANLCVFIVAYAQFILKFSKNYDLILSGGNVVSYTKKKLSKS